MSASPRRVRIRSRVSRVGLLVAVALASGGLLATAACVNVPGDVRGAFSPANPGEPSHYRRKIAAPENPPTFLEDALDAAAHADAANDGATDGAADAAVDAGAGAVTNVSAVDSGANGNATSDGGMS